MYGAMFRTADGRRIVDTDEFTFYAKASGAARILQAVGAASDYAGGFVDAGPFGAPARDPVACFYRTFWAANSLTHVGETDGAVRKKTWRANPRFSESDICFWRPGASGIYWMDEAYLSNDWAVFNGVGTVTAGASFWSAGPSGTAPAWIAASLERQAVAGAMGMQLRNASNQITFDSRQDLLAIEYTRIITAAEMADVLDSNATLTITLPRSLPGCYIHSPIWKSFRRVSAILSDRTDVYLPLLRQASATTLTVSRYTVPRNGTNVWSANPEDIYSQAWDGAPGSGVHQAYYFDTPLFVSKGVL